MRIGLSEPECSILTTQESKPSVAIGSSAPVISRPFITENCDPTATVSTSTSSPLHSSSQIRTGTTTQSPPAAITSVSSGPASFGSASFGAFGSTQAPAFGSVASDAPTQRIFGSMQTPSFGSCTSATSTPSTFGLTQAPAFGSVAFGAPTQPFGSMKAPSFGSGASGAPTQSIFGSTPAPSFDSCASATSTQSTFGPMQTPAFGSGAFSAPTPYSFGGYSLFSAPTATRFGSMRAPVQATFGSGASTTSASFPFGPAQDFGKTDSASQVFATNGWSHGIKQGSRSPRYAPTHDGCGIYISISASNSYSHKSHEELRWEDYKQGDEGVSFPSAHLSPISSGAQRPHETIAVSSPASGCTACGATTSSSASGNFTFNGATIPPSAATSLSGLFFPASGSCPVMFGTTPAAQVTTNPALQAYPVHGFLLLPSTAMNLLQ